MVLDHLNAMVINSNEYRCANDIFELEVNQFSENQTKFPIGTNPSSSNIQKSPGKKPTRKGYRCGSSKSQV